MAKGGKRKGSGRIKGVPNKRTLAITERIEARYPGFSAVEAMTALGHDELEALKAGPATEKEIADLFELTDPTTRRVYLMVIVKRFSASKEFALAALKEAAQYVEAKRKAVEITGELTTAKERPEGIRALADSIRAGTSVSGAA
jgi:hypothetical protein